MFSQFVLLLKLGADALATSLKNPSVVSLITAQVAAQEGWWMLWLSTTFLCPKHPLQFVGPQELHQLWRVTVFSSGVLDHAQHWGCRAPLLIERNPKPSFLKVIMRQWYKTLFSSSKVLKFITVRVFNLFLYLKPASDLHLQFKAYSILEKYFCFYSGKKKKKKFIRCQSFTQPKSITRSI